MTSDSETQSAPDTGPESVQSESEQPDAEQPDAEQPDAEQPDAERPDAERPDAERPDAEQPGAAQPGPAQTTVETEVTVRRIPRYSRFLIIGAGLGAVATFILTTSFPSDPKVGFGALFGYFLLFGVPAGAVIGAVVAILLDIGLTRRARTGLAERTTVDPLLYEDEPAVAEAPESPGETASR